MNEERRRLSATDRIAVAVATAGGAGFVPKLPGTIGSLVGVGLHALMLVLSLDRAIYLSILFVIGAAGIWAAGRVESIYGHDASKIAIDEVIGQLLTLGLVYQTSVVGIILGFLLFRFFDILKPFPIRRLERLPGGLGVVVDDVGAAGYALLALLIIESQRAGLGTPPL